MQTPTTVRERANTSLLGGISSAFRVNPFVGGHLEVRKAHGAQLETTDGRTYLDMFMAHGSTLLGHAHPAVFQAVRDSLDDGVVDVAVPLGARSRDRELEDGSDEAGCEQYVPRD